MEMYLLGLMYWRCIAELNGYKNVFTEVYVSRDALLRLMYGDVFTEVDTV